MSQVAQTWSVANVRELRDAIEAANAGDTIVMAAGDYTVYGLDYRWNTPESRALRDAAGLTDADRKNTGDIHIDKSLTIKTTGGRVNLSADGDLTKGIFVIDQTAQSVSIDNFGFFDNKGQWNANLAGIRYYGGDLTVTNSEFGNNNNGILGNAIDGYGGTVHIINSEFYGAGNAGLQHNIYVATDALIFENSTSRAPIGGNHVKTLSAKTVLRDNTFDDAGTNAGRFVDVEGGGDLLIEGNSLRRTASAENTDYIFYSAYRGVGETGSVVVRDNDIVNEGRSDTYLVRNLSDAVVEVYDNRISDPEMVPGTIFRSALVRDGLSHEWNNVLNGRVAAEFEPTSGLTTYPASEVALFDSAWFEGTSAQELIATGNGLNRVLAGEGDDVLLVTPTPGRYDGRKGDAVFGEDGDDLIVADNGQVNLLAGGPGEDVLIGGPKGFHFVYGGDDDDLLWKMPGNRAARFVGGDGDDVLIAADTNGGHRLAGGDGDDVFVAYGADVGFIGGDGVDTVVYGGDFADYTVHRQWGLQNWIWTDDSSFFTEFDGRGAGHHSGRSQHHILPDDIEQVQFRDGIYRIHEQKFLPGAAVVDVDATLQDLQNKLAGLPPVPATTVGPSGDLVDPASTNQSVPRTRSIVTGTAGDDAFAAEEKPEHFLFDPAAANQGDDRIADFDLDLDRLVFGASGAVGGPLGALPLSVLAGKAGWSLTTSGSGDLLVDYGAGRIELVGHADAKTISTLFTVDVARLLIDGSGASNGSGGGSTGDDTTGSDDAGGDDSTGSGDAGSGGDSTGSGDAGSGGDSTGSDDAGGGGDSTDSGDAGGDDATRSGDADTGGDTNGPNDAGGGGDSTGSDDAGSGDDLVLHGTRGDDLIEGGAGTDTFVLAGDRGDHRIYTVDGKITVDGPAGTDTLVGVERIAFADARLWLDADFDDSGIVDIADVELVVTAYRAGLAGGDSTADTPQADLDGDGVVDAGDVELVAALYGSTTGGADDLL